MTNELIVREIGATPANLATLAPGASEPRDNVARFFNDTPFDLELVAVRIGSIPSLLMIATDTAQHFQLFAVAELSRQAQAGQQEGIICSVRGAITVYKNTVATGANGGASPNIGELVFGDFKTPMMVLETQTNLFLHAVLTNLAGSLTTAGIGAFGASVGATLYFKKKGSRRR